MAKELIVSVNGREKKIAIVEDDSVTEFYVERGDENQGIVGNIYKGRVMKVLPGMQSAFVDIGLERDAFLYVSDFIEDEDDDGAFEERKAIAPQPQAKQERPRPAARVAQPEPVEAVEPADETEEELQVLALRHIEELAEEPVVEPADEDEIEELAAIAPEKVAPPAAPVEVEPEGRKARRQRRLRYAEPEEPAAPVVEAPVKEAKEAREAKEAKETREAGEASEAGEAEPEEGGGRRRRRPRRKRGAEAVEVTAEPVEAEVSEAEIVETAETAETAEPGLIGPKVGSSEFEGLLLAQHELERVIDDEMEGIEGEMLKDAMVQEKITGRIHAEEIRTSILEVEPTPEVRVGSLRSSLPGDSDFERVSDDETIEAALDEDREAQSSASDSDSTSNLAEEEAEAETGVETEEESAATSADEQAAEPSAESQDEAGGEADEEAAGEGVGLAASEEDASEEAASALNGEEREAGEDDAASEIAASEAEGLEAEAGPLEDASAEVRHRPGREEMATRRGGRGRRRFRRTPVTDATGDGEDERDGDDEQAEAPPISYSRPIERFHRPVISDLLREGQEILVQIAKEPIGQKGARITSHIALPGRYIVYMPTVEHIGVSRKIGTDEERQRLRRTLHQLRAETGAPGGFIVRTAANGCTTEELRDDMQYLLRTWSDIRRRTERAKAPAIIHRDLDLVQRILRDQLSSDFNAIRVDNEFEYERIVDFVNRFAPKLVHRVKLYTKDTPILEEYGVQPEIDKAVKPRVWLKSGGYIVINQTEALVAIDVNTGKFVGKSNRLEDTIVKTNLEAAKEIVRQIRLRDLGGIIVLDFIDMEERRNRMKVMQALEQELKSDRSPSKILQFNDFGLVAVTRKRVKQSLERTLCTPCPYCAGGGMVKSPQTVCYEILAEARRVSKDVDSHNEIILRVSPEVAKALRSTERDVFAEIEAYLGGVVTIKSDAAVHQEQFDIALV